MTRPHGYHGCMGTVLLAAPRGYCAGVERAVEAVERALAKHGAPDYVRKHCPQRWSCLPSSQSRRTRP